MELHFVILGLVSLAACIGGISAFFALFSSSSKSTRIDELEQEIKQLRIQLESFRQRLDRLPQQASPPIPPVAMAANITTGLSSAVPSETKAKFVAKDVDDGVIQKSSASAPVVASHEKTHAQPAPTNYWDLPEEDPGFIERGISAAKDWLFGGNTLVRSGIVILFIGVAFLLKLAVDKNFIPIELRLTAVALLGVGLLVIGWRLRDQRAEYSWALQGGGIGVMYLTIFAAFKLYQLIPSGAAFGLLIVVAFLLAFIAVKQSALPLAILGFTGGFLAPVFTSTGHGSHVGLFSYYLVLNSAIAFIAFHKSWRGLNVLGFVFTFIIGSIWGAKSYQPEHFATTEPFLIIHFLLFTAIAVLFAHRQATKASDYVDATLVFGTPLVGFSLQYALLRDSHFGLAYSALVLGMFYIALASWVLTRKRDTLKFLGECFLALGIGFITLTLPLALDGRWTSAAWAVEGVGLLWVGLKQNHTFPTLSGLALQLLGAGAFMQGWGLTGHTGVATQNMFLGVGFIALSGWACGALWNKYRPDQFGVLTTLLALWGWLWWVASGLTAIDEFMPRNLFVHTGLAFVAITSELLPFASRYFKWPKLAALAGLLLPVMVIALMINGFDNVHPFAHYGYFIWPLAFAVYMWILTRDVLPKHALLRAPLLWLMAIVGVIEWRYQLGQSVSESNVWQEIGWAIVPMIIMGAVTRWQRIKQETDTKRTWLWIGCTPLAVFLVAWFLIMSLHSSGNAAPLPYIPLLNPLDITLAAVVLLLLVWQRAVGEAFNKLHEIKPILASMMGFALLNGMLLRTLHHWAGTPFEWTSIFSNSTVQMSFTLLWGITAFILMVIAHKRLQRKLWIMGAALMGLVVAKIFLLDLAQHGSVERIVSFIGAGLMLLVMGYFAPLPPVKTNATEEVSA